MKKVNIQSIVWAFLIAASISSYTYLSFQAYGPQGVCNASTHKLEKIEEQEVKVILPDIALVKKILNVTKIVIPKD